MLLRRTSRRGREREADSPRARASRVHARPPAGSATRGDGSRPRQEALADGCTPLQAQGRRRRSTPTAAAHACCERRSDPSVTLMARRQPGVGRRRGDRLDPACSRRSTRGGSRSRRARTTCSATAASAVVADRRRDRRARAEPRHVQAADAGRGDRLSARSTLPPRWRQRGPGRRCCWRRSSACRCARTPAASGSASTCSTSRCSTTCGQRSLEDRACEFVDHLHEHFVTRSGSTAAGTWLRRAPGYSAEIKPGSLERFEYPDGDAWTVDEHPMAEGSSMGT